MIKSKEIELLKNLSQYEFEGDQYYDFHNDYDCTCIFFKNDGELELKFKSIVEENTVYLKFYNVRIVLFKFFNYSKVQNLTIDNLYRGRIESDGRLIEFIEDEIGYYYLEFEEGQKIEFWSSGVSIIKPSLA